MLIYHLLSNLKGTCNNRIKNELTMINKVRGTNQS